MNDYREKVIADLKKGIKRSVYGPNGIRLTLDPKQVVPDNPGEGTPGMVYYRDGCSTFTCATCEGTVDSNRNGEIELSDRQLAWLNDQEDLLAITWEAGEAAWKMKQTILRHVHDA